MATTISLSNVGKPSPPIWKKIGNWALYGGWAIAVVAKFFVPEPYKSIIMELMVIFGPLIKGATKLTFDPAKVPLSYFPQPEPVNAPETKDVTKEVEKIDAAAEKAEAKLTTK